MTKQTALAALIVIALFVGAACARLALFEAGPLRRTDPRRQTSLCHHTGFPLSYLAQAIAPNALEVAATTAVVFAGFAPVKDAFCVFAD